MHKVNIGDIVLYKVCSDELCLGFITIDDITGFADIVPGIIVGINQDGSVNLHLFGNSGGHLFKQKVSFGIYLAPIA